MDKLGWGRSIALRSLSSRLRFLLVSAIISVCRSSLASCIPSREF